MRCTSGCGAGRSWWLRARRRRPPCRTRCRTTWVRSSRHRAGDPGDPQPTDRAPGDHGRRRERGDRGPDRRGPVVADARRRARAAGRSRRAGDAARDRARRRLRDRGRRSGRLARDRAGHRDGTGVGANAGCRRARCHRSDLDQRGVPRGARGSDDRARRSTARGGRCRRRTRSRRSSTGAVARSRCTSRGRWSVDRSRGRVAVGQRHACVHDRSEARRAVTSIIATSPRTRRLRRPCTCGRSRDRHARPMEVRDGRTARAQPRCHVGAARCRRPPRRHRRGPVASSDRSRRGEVSRLRDRRAVAATHDRDVRYR